MAGNELAYRSLFTGHYDQYLPFNPNDLYPEYKRYLKDREKELILYSICCFSFLIFFHQFEKLKRKTK